MQSMKLSMTSARIETGAYSKQQSASKKGAGDVTSFDKANGRNASGNASFSLLDYLSKRQGYSLSSFFNGGESERTSSYRSFNLKIQSMSFETFNEQNTEYDNVSQGFRFSYTSIEISMESSESSNIYDDIFGDDGYWGSEKTSQRLFDFVKSLAGNDPEKLEQARAGAVKGYKSVENVIGEMPKVCVDTLDKLMEKIDAYKNEITNNKSVDVIA